jgi:hypothetical protein
MGTTLIASVCSLPRDFRAVGTKSVVTLLREAGYFDHPTEVSVDAIRAYLATKPELIEDWITYSSDKRTTGWYLIDDGTLGYFPGGPQSSYEDIVTACAEFIIRELSDIRRHAG